MTHVSFDRSGGVTANPMHLDLELENLPEADSQNLLRLIAESVFFDLPEDPAVNPSGDEFQYTIGINAEDRSHTIHVSDSTMPNSLLPLIKELTLLKMFQS